MTPVTLVAEEAFSDMRMQENRAALMGYGIMGRAMAECLLERGFGVSVYDVDESRRIIARNDGCGVATTPAELATFARTVVISLPKPEHVRHVVQTGPDPLLDEMTEGSVIVDTSTVDPETSRENWRAAKNKGVGYVDSPVLGRPSKAGNWTLPTGGEPADIEAASPVLLAFAANIVHIGPVGHGNMLKLLNNLMFGAINSVTGEVFALSLRLGLDPRLFFETVVNSGAGTVSNLFKELGPKIVDNDYDPNFSIDNLEKDVGLGIAMAKSNGMQLDVSEAGQNMNQKAKRLGLGNQDSSAVWKIFGNDAEDKGSSKQ